MILIIPLCLLLPHWHMEIRHLLILKQVEYGLQDKTKNIIVHSVGIYIAMIVRL